MRHTADPLLAVCLDAEPDADLVGRMRAAHGDALDALFRRYGRLVHRVAADILHDRGEAEDVTQEVFLEVFRKAHLYDAARGSVRVWLLQYAYHRTLRRKASLRRRAAYGAEPLDAVVEQADGEPGRLTRDERRWLIRAALAQLPERQRLTLELACFEELSLRDVAARLGVSLGCTRHYYYRGLARLREWAATGAPARPNILRRVARPRRTASSADTTGAGTDRGRSLCVRF